MRKSIFDPRSKLLVFLTACFLAFSGISQVQEFVLVALSVVPLILCGQIAFVAKLLFVFAGMLFVDINVVQQISGTGQFALLIICRCLRFVIPIIGAAYLVIHTSATGEYISALMKMKMPNAVIIPVAVMFRFIPTMKEEFTTISQALKMRGLGIGWRNILQRPMDILEYVLVPFLLQASIITDELSAAVMARGLEKDSHRTSYIEIKMTLRDYVMIGICIVFLLWTFLE